MYFTLIRYDLTLEGKLFFRGYNEQHEAERQYYEQSSIFGVDKVKLFAYTKDEKHEFHKGKGYIKCIK